MMVTRENLRLFLDRPWDELRAAKDRSTAATARKRGTAFALRMAEELNEMAPPPTAEERAADLASHIRVRKIFDRAYRNSPGSR
jgi:hypothetical protein